MTAKLRKTITLLLAAVFAISTGLLIRHGFDAVKSADAYASAEEIARKPQEMKNREEPGTERLSEFLESSEPVIAWIPAPVEADAYMEQLREINLDALRETNPNVVGWIFLPDCKINYPIVQGEDNRYYLKHTWDNQNSHFGAIFMESTNSGDFLDFRTILYGHNMEDFSMFGSLQRYDAEKNWKKYPYVYLVTDEGVLRYEIYSSYKAKVDSDTYALNLTQEVHRQGFINLTKEAARYETGITPAVTDRLLTLSTCVGDSGARRVVHARLPMIQVEMKTDSPQ